MFRATSAFGSLRKMFKNRHGELEPILKTLYEDISMASDRVQHDIVSDIVSYIKSYSGPSVDPLSLLPTSIQHSLSSRSLRTTSTIDSRDDSNHASTASNTDTYNIAHLIAHIFV